MRLPYLCAGTLTLLAMALAGGQAACAPASEPTYLVILGRPESFSAEFPPSPADSPRQVGWGVVLYTLTTPLAELRRNVEGALDTCERTGYPLLLHLDDWNFPPPSTDPEWVEWTSFPAPGEKYGPLVRRRWINWGSWMTAGPPPNYESPKFRAFMRAQVAEGVAKPVAERLRKWRKEGRANLLAGVVVGWESGYYSMPAPADEPKTDKESFEDSEVVTTGYAALTRRGYTAAKLAAEARRRGVTEAALFRVLMTDVVHDYTEFLCQQCVKGGVPRARVYSHYAAAFTTEAPATVAADGRMLPIETAVNRYSRPGLTMAQSWANYDKVASALTGAGRKDWGAVEIEVVPATRAEEATLEQLRWLAGHGARVMCYYGWWEAEGHLFAIRGTGAVGALRRWLAEG
jgi:hypothetical protein